MCQKPFPRALRGRLACMLYMLGPSGFLGPCSKATSQGQGGLSRTARAFLGWHSALCWRPGAASPSLPGHSQSCHRRAGLAGLPCQGNADIQLSAEGKILLPPVTCEECARGVRKPKRFHTRACVRLHAGPQTHTHIFIFVVSNLLN